MASDDKNGNGGTLLRRILEPLIVAAVVGLLVMYGTVKIIQTQLEAVVATLQETRQIVKDDVRDMGELKAWKSAMETKLDYMQRQKDSRDAWGDRKR